MTAPVNRVEAFVGDNLAERAQERTRRGHGRLSALHLVDAAARVEKSAFELGAMGLRFARARRRLNAGHEAALEDIARLEDEKEALLRELAGAKREHAELAGVIEGAAWAKRWRPKAVGPGTPSQTPPPSGESGTPDVGQLNAHLRAKSTGMSA